VNLETYGEARPYHEFAALEWASERSGNASSAALVTFRHRRPTVS